MAPNVVISMLEALEVKGFLRLYGRCKALFWTPKTHPSSSSYLTGYVVGLRGFAAVKTKIRTPLVFVVALIVGNVGNFLCADGGRRARARSLGRSLGTFINHSIGV